MHGEKMGTCPESAGKEGKRGCARGCRSQRVHNTVREHTNAILRACAQREHMESCPSRVPCSSSS